MKKKRLFRKLGSHESPVHSRKDALRIKRSCEDYVGKLNCIHQRAVDHLNGEIERLKKVVRESRCYICYDIPRDRAKSACNDMMIDERYVGSIPKFVISCQRFTNETMGRGVATYRMRMDYDSSVPPFDHNACNYIIESIGNILRYITKGNY